jgi:chromosome segregation ATPase
MCPTITKECSGMDLQRLLFGKQPPAAMLREAIADNEAEGQTITVELAALAERRERILLNGQSDKDLDQIDADFKALARRQDRCDAAQHRLRERLAEAERVEKQEEVDAIHRRAVGAQTLALDLLGGKFATLCQQLAAVAGEIDASEREIDTCNAALTAAGDSRHVVSIETAWRTAILEGMDAASRPHAIISAPHILLRLPDVAPPARDIMSGRILLWPRKTEQGG